MALAVGLSTTLADGWLNTLRNVAYQKAALWQQLHTAIPGSAGTASISANDNTRKTFTFAVPSGQALALTGTAPVWTSTQDFSETVSHASVHDASTAGVFQWSYALAASKTWTTTGDTLTSTAIGLSLTPIATT